MRLLEKIIVQNERQKSIDEEIKLAQRTTELLISESQKFQKFQEEIEEKRSVLQRALINDTEEYQKSIHRLQKQVSDLEDAQRKAKEPLTEQENVLKLKELNILRRECSLETQESILRDKNTELLRAEEELKLQEKNIKELKSQEEQRNSRLIEQIKEVEQDKEQAARLRADAIAFQDSIQGSIAQSQEEIRVEKALLKSKSEELSEKDKQLKAETKHIESQQITLRLAYDELKRKQNGGH